MTGSCNLPKAGKYKLAAGSCNLPKTGKYELAAGSYNLPKAENMIKRQDH